MKLLQKESDRKISCSLSMKRSTKNKVFELQDNIKEEFNIKVQASDLIESFILEYVIPYYLFCIDNSKLISFREFKEEKKNE